MPDITIVEGNNELNVEMVPISVPDVPEGFAISNLTFTPETVGVGYPVTISIRITRLDGATGTLWRFRFHIDSEIQVLELASFALKVGETREFSITYTPTEVKTYYVRIGDLEGSFVATELPEIMLSALPMEPLSPVSTSSRGRIRISDLTIEPSVVHIGENVIISVEVANRYSGGASFGVDCTVDHTVVRQSGGLSAGERVLVSWQATPYVAKTFSVDIDGEWSGLIGSFEAIE